MTTTNNSSILKDVVAYVDVWSSDKTANYSKPFVQQLQEMGAQVSKTFNKQVTHVVFNNGHPATWRKARKSNVKLVSVLWVGRCFDDGVHVDEELYPALDETNPVLKNKKHRCMQPKDSPERTPENDRRMKKKLDKMMKDLVPRQPLDTDVSPIIIDEKNGIVYSPAFKRSDYMAQRLKDMKEKHESLSPTASQMVESCSPTGLKPSLGSTPTVLKLMYDQSDDDSSASAAEPAYSPDKEEERTLRNVTDHSHLKQRQRKNSENPSLSPCHYVPKQISSPVKCPDFIDEEDEDWNTPKKSRRTSVRKKPAEKHKSIDLQESPSQNRRSDNSKNLKKEAKRSQIKSSSPSPNKAAKGKRKIKAAKSFTETMTQFFPDAVISSSCLSSPSELGEAVVKLSKENSTPLQQAEPKTPKNARSSLSSMVQSFTPSAYKKSVVSGSTDGDDNVFEDFFSPVNRHQKSKRPLLPNLPLEKDIQIPFELGSGPKKRKQRRSESLGSETNSQKKKKLEKSQRGKNCNLQVDESSVPPSPSQQNAEQSLPALESSRANVTLLTKRRRQNTLPVTSTSTTDNAVKQRGTSTSVHSTMLIETNTVSKLQKNSDVGVLSQTLEDDQSDDDFNASVAKPAYLLEKKEGRIQRDVTDHSHLKQHHRKSSENPSLSPCHDVQKRVSTPLKCPDFIDEEDEDWNTPKKSRRTSVRKKPAEKHKSIDLQESPSQGRRSDNNKNFQKETKRSQIKSSSPSPNKAAKGKRKIKAAKSFTETMTQFFPDAVNSPSCLSSPAKLGEAIVKLSKENSTLPLQEMEQKTCKQATPSLSSMVRSFTPSGDSKSVVSGTTEGDDNVFEDYFSPANQKSKRPLLPNLPVKKDIQIPFELGSGPKKRKQRRSESLGSETNSQKKKNLEKSQRGKNCNQQFDESSVPPSPSQQDVKPSLPALDSSSTNVTLLTKQRGQNTLPITRTTDNAVKQRETATLSTSTIFMEASTVSELQQHTDVSVLSHTLESGGNECTVAAGSTEIPSEGEYHNKQVSLSLQKMVNKTKAMRTLVMTSMPTEKQHIVGELVKTLGGFSIVDRVCESTTHVVSGGHRRTLNILLGIARGCWILSFEWILWCLEQRQWIPEEPYELSDQFPAAQICRLQRHLSAGEHQQDLFQSQPTMFVSQHSQPPTQSLVELIQLCGGTVCKTVRQAGICIGKYSGRRPEGSRILSEQWVLDSITHLKQLSYDNYDLE